MTDPYVIRPLPDCRLGWGEFVAGVIAVRNEFFDVMRLPMTEPLPSIPLTPVKSSNVVGIGYDPETRTARVQFRNGSTYRYADVPPELHAAIMESRSIGSAVRQLRVHPTTQEPVS